jgi:hypothetical protein
MSDPLAYSLPDFLKLAGIGRTKFYRELRAGRLKAKKNGARTVVLAADAKAYLENLPALTLDAA